MDPLLGSVFAGESKSGTRNKFLDVSGRGTSLTDIVVVLSRVGVSQLGSDDG